MLTDSDGLCVFDFQLHTTQVNAWLTPAPLTPLQPVGSSIQLMSRRGLRQGERHHEVSVIRVDSLLLFEPPKVTPKVLVQAGNENKQFSQWARSLSSFSLPIPAAHLHGAL